MASVKKEAIGPSSKLFRINWRWVEMWRERHCSRWHRQLKQQRGRTVDQAVSRFTGRSSHTDTLCCNSLALFKRKS